MYIHIYLFYTLIFYIHYWAIKKNLRITILKDKEGMVLNHRDLLNLVS